MALMSKAAIVTGAAQGIGKAIAARLVKDVARFRFTSYFSFFFPAGLSFFLPAASPSPSFRFSGDGSAEALREYQAVFQEIVSSFSFFKVNNSFRQTGPALRHRHRVCFRHRVCHRRPDFPYHRRQSDRLLRL